MHTVHNARILLLATVCNNLGLAVIVATLIAPAIDGQFLAQVHFRDVGLGRAWNHPTSGGQLVPGGCGNDLGTNAHMVDLAGVRDPGDRNRCRCGGPLHPVNA
jgi:hypothetical protein